MKDQYYTNFFLNVLSMGLHRDDDQENLKFIYMFKYEKSILHKINPNIVSMGLHRNDDKKTKTETF